MRTFLVTGGAGFIGSHIAEALVARGDRVRVLDNLSTGSVANLAGFRDRIEFIEATLSIRPRSIARSRASIAFSTRRPWPRCSGASTARWTATPPAARARSTCWTQARRAGVRRVVFAASAAAYGDQPLSSKRETDLVDPLSPYAAAKLASEHYCHAFSAAFKLETVALRYFNVFGPRQDPASPYSAVIPLFITAMLSGRQPAVFGDGRQSRDFVFVANVVQANLLAADAPNVAGRTFNVAEGRATDL